ncbi:MAG: diguanylate cyclase [Lachnospiraceae bacterium]|nr:diguanylate cyclase [Lachnospiraceae bacterium]
MLREYILQNWASVMILLAFAVMLKTTVFLDHKVIRRMYILIIAMILYTFGKNAKGYIFIPALVVAGVNFLSIPTGIVFSLDEAGQLHRGPLGYLPYIAVGVYSFILVFILFKQSKRLATETIPILFLSFSFISGLGLPFILGKAYSEIFVTTIVVALFIYYVFSILQLTSKDSLTGLLNRQAYYAAVKGNSRDITAPVSIDMNGLKAINDTKGHAAGDEALKFLPAVSSVQSERNSPFTGSAVTSF